MYGARTPHYGRKKEKKKKEEDVKIAYEKSRELSAPVVDSVDLRAYVRTMRELMDTGQCALGGYGD
jgi:hypothetical protein